MLPPIIDFFTKQNTTQAEISTLGSISQQFGTSTRMKDISQHKKRVYTRKQKLLKTL